MNFWGKIKKDLKKGIEDIDWEKIRGEVQLGIKKGMKAVRKGTAAVKEKAEELTEEGERRYKIFTLKKKVHHWMAELGGKVYGLSLKTTNPMNDTTVKLIVGCIKRLEAQIARLETKTQASSKKRMK
jgi:hypothetical protein